MDFAGELAKGKGLACLRDVFRDSDPLSFILLKKNPEEPRSDFVISVFMSAQCETEP